MKHFHGGAAALTLAACAAVQAQTTVYESKDKAGPVFSDKPAAGAAVVDLPPPNVVSVPKPPPVTPPAAAAVPPYRSLVFVSLVGGATVHSNTGAFNFSARSVPALRAGDRVRIRLDGQVLATSYRSLNLRITEADWRKAARSSSVEHTLQLAIVDGQGAVVIESVPIRFFVHRAAVGGQRQ